MMPSTLDKLDFVDVKANDIMGCTESTRVCLKFTLVFLNIPVVIVGIISLSVGLWVMVSDTTFFDLTADVLDLEVLGQDILHHASIVMVTAGAAILVLAGLGVMGALAMNSCMLVFYVVMLVVLLTLESSVIVLALVFKSELESRIHRTATEKLISQYGDSASNNSRPFTQMFNRIQQKLDCCGWEGGWEYTKVDRSRWNTTMTNGQLREVPDSCCMGENTTWTQECVVSPYNSSSFSIMGCRDAVQSELCNYQWLVIGATIAVLAFQFLILIVTLALIVHNVNNKYHLS